MGEDNTNRINAKNDVIELIASDNFNSMSNDLKKMALNSVSVRGESEGGFMGKIFGHKKENASMNIAFILCVLLAVIGCICVAFGKDYWDVIIPAITTGMGYMFGKGDK